MKSLNVLLVLVSVLLSISLGYSQDIRDKGVGNIPEEKKQTVKPKSTHSNVWITGKVIDKETGKGIPGVTITIVDFSKGLGLVQKVTNKSGTFILYPLKGVDTNNLNLVIRNYQNLPPLMLPISPTDKKITIYKSGNSWSWTKE